MAALSLSSSSAELSAVLSVGVMQSTPLFLGALLFSIETQVFLPVSANNLGLFADVFGAGASDLTNLMDHFVSDTGDIMKKDN